MFIKYRGGRTNLKISLNRQSYYFTKENGRILDIKDQAVINYIFSLPNNAEFETVMEEAKVELKKDESIEVKIKCAVCGFVAKSEQGLLVHLATKHKKGGK